MRGLRPRLAREHPDAAFLAAGRFEPPNPGVAAGYVPRGSEIDPGPLLARLASRGWSIALPRAGDRDGRLTFHAADARREPDAFGIQAPVASAPVLTPDLIIVPVVAFDRRGGRLGQGAGCYDRTIAELRRRGAVRVVGLAFAGQEVEESPTEDHDERLDAIVTETALIEVLRMPP